MLTTSNDPRAMSCFTNGDPSQSGTSESVLRYASAQKTTSSQGRDPIMADASCLSGETGRFCSQHGKIGEYSQLIQHASTPPCPGTDRYAMEQSGSLLSGTSGSRVTKCFPDKELAKQQYMENGGAEHIATLARRLGKDERTLARQIGFVI